MITFLKKFQREKKGFTLIEVMVAVSIFAIVVTVGLSALLNMSVAHTNARAKQSAMDHLNFALETMSREIRIGSRYHCGSINFTTTADCPEGSSVLSFYTFENKRGAFRLANGAIEATLDDTGDFSTLTPESITITDLSFRVVGSGLIPDTRQPMIMMTIEGESQIREEEASFIFQTTITQRRPDLASAL